MQSFPFNWKTVKLTEIKYHWKWWGLWFKVLFWLNETCCLENGKTDHKPERKRKEKKIIHPPTW